MDEVSYSLHTYVFCASQLLQSLKSKGGSPQLCWQDITFPLTDVKKDKVLAISERSGYVFPLQLPPGLTWTPGPRICSKHTGEDWTLLTRVLDNVSPGTVLPEPFTSVWQMGQRLEKIMENLGKSPHTYQQINVIFISITYYYSEIENQKVLSVKEAHGC